MQKEGTQDEMKRIVESVNRPPLKEKMLLPFRFFKLFESKGVVV